MIHFQKGKAKFERKAEYNQHSHEEVIWEYYNFSDNISCFFAITYTYYKYAPLIFQTYRVNFRCFEKGLYNIYIYIHIYKYFYGMLLAKKNIITHIQHM